MSKLKIQQRKVEELIPYANNAKIHKEEQITVIADSIKEFGFNNPILLDGDNGVIEPFGGSGSTLIGAEKTNRKCYTMELSPVYCDTIVRRWQEFTGREAILESTGEAFNAMAEQ